MKIKVSRSFLPLFDITKRYLVMCGGAGSGKSEFAARKIFRRSMKELTSHKHLILRKVRKTLRQSVIEVVLKILEDNEVNYDFNKSERVISFLNPVGFIQEILFDGLDEREKIKSIKGVTSIWMEEATEFSKEDFMQIDLRLREATQYYKQLMLTFNPDEAKAPWLKEMFFDRVHPDSFVHRSTIEDNPIKEVQEEYIRILDGLDDDTYFTIYREGEWAVGRGVIFDWKVDALPDIEFDEVFIGGDFGFSINPAAIAKIYRKADHYWVKELLYATGLTNLDLIAFCRSNDEVDDSTIQYWDSAEPKSIKELHDGGLNVRGTIKGKDSVRAGIDYCKSVKITIVDGSPNILEERRGYKYKETRSGIPTDEPVKFKDHMMDAIRGAIYTNYLLYLKRRRKGRVHHAGRDFVKQKITEDERLQKIKESIRHTRMSKEMIEDEKDAQEQTAPVSISQEGRHGRKKGRVHYIK